MVQMAIFQFRKRSFNGAWIERSRFLRLIGCLLVFLSMEPAIANPELSVSPLRESADLCLPDTTSIAVDEIRINAACRWQKLDGIGANSFSFPFANDIGYEWDRVKFVYDELDLHYIRLVSWFGFWESQNDNADAQTIAWDAFDQPPGTVGRHDVPYAQWLHRRGIEVELGIWNVGDWLASGNPRQISPHLYPELGETIASYLLNLQNQGVAPAVTEVQNEPDITAGIRYPNPESLRDAALQILDQLDHVGLNQVMLHGPNLHRPEGTVAWAEVWFANPRLRDRTIALSYHTWWSEDRAAYEAIRSIAERYGKPVWATELGLCALNDPAICGSNAPLRTDTWETAFDYAQSFYRAIDWSHASRLYLWTVLGHDGTIGPEGQRYPTFYITKHFANYIPPDSIYLQSLSRQSDLQTMAFALPDGGYSLIVINSGQSAHSLRLEDEQQRRWVITQAITSSQDNYEQRTMVANEGEQWWVTFPPRSVTSLSLTVPSSS